MTAPVHSARLSELLTAVEEARSWPPGLLDALRAQIEGGSDASLSQINPIAWAEDHGFEPDTTIAMFLHATRMGLVDIQWSVRCCGCGELVQNPSGLGQLDHDFYCTSCARTRPTTLDESVEVSFTVAPQIRTIRFHDPASLDLDDYFFAFRFSRNIQIREIDRQLVEFLRAQTLILSWLEPGSTQTHTIDVPEAGWVVGSPRAMITTEGEATTEVRELTLDYFEDSLLPRPKLAPGPLRLTLRNTTEERVRVFLYFTPLVTYFDYLPHLSGHRLLNDAEFRRCLGTDVVRPGAGIPVNDNTLLFTDLRGSTQMYDRIGDHAAFALVTEHFEAMARTVTRCGGVVVKTMGDAIMASFTRPADAVRAALGILEHSEREAAKRDEGEQLQPKLGVHRGPCIVVNQNDMVDYFGQTVNIAARVQGAANSNELCITAAVWTELESDVDLAAALARYETRPPELVALKGVSEAVALYRVAARSPL